jgi:hypothetical protein
LSAIQSLIVDAALRLSNRRMQAVGLSVIVTGRPQALSRHMRLLLWPRLAFDPTIFVEAMLSGRSGTHLAPKRREVGMNKKQNKFEVARDGQESAEEGNNLNEKIWSPGQGTPEPPDFEPDPMHDEGDLMNREKSDEPCRGEKNGEKIKGFDMPVTTPAERQGDARRITM